MKHDYAYKTTEAARAIARKYYYAHHAENMAKNRMYAKRSRIDPVKKLTRDLGRFGITAADYAALLAAQAGVCAICRQPETYEWKGKTQRLAVDHNHQTKQVRGLLCRNCNVFIGIAGESLNRLQAAQDYLMKHESAIAC